MPLNTGDLRMTDENSIRETKIKSFFNAFNGKNIEPLEQDSPFYVPILAQKPESDPILSLKTRIEWESSQSTNLLTGFRGNGKSTELRRLKKLLETDGCRVFLVNMLDYILVSKPVELSDFILSLMSGLAYSVKDETGIDTVSKGYWERLKTFLKSEVKSDGLTLKTGTEELSAEIGLRLKTDATFKDILQKSLAGHITTLVKDAREFIVSMVDTLRKNAGNPDLKVVLLVDSVEQLRGQGGDAEKVQNSVSELFSGQAGNLAFPKLHIVYTVPPYITAMAQNIGRAFGGNPISSWPNIHVRKKTGGDDPDGLSIMRTIVCKRYPEWRNFFTEAHLEDLAKASGGDLRDYFRLIRECLIILRNKPSLNQVDEAVLAMVKNQLKKELTPIAADDAQWLARVHATKDTSLATISELPRLARFLDSNLMMNYLNGEPWYDIHPLIIDEINKLTGQPAQ